MSGWYSLPVARLAQNMFWPSETTIDILVRDWAVCEGRFDWYLPSSGASDAAWTTVAYLSLYLPVWGWDVGFGTYSISIAATLEFRVGVAGDRIYVRLGTSGSGTSTTGAAFSTTRVSNTFTYTTAPTGKVDFPIQAYTVDNGGGGGGFIQRSVGLLDGSGNLDTWAVVLS